MTRWTPKPRSLPPEEPCPPVEVTAKPEPAEQPPVKVRLRGPVDRLFRHLAPHDAVGGCPSVLAVHFRTAGRPSVSGVEARAELNAHVDAGWLEEVTRRECGRLVTRYRVTVEGWTAVKGDPTL